MPCVGEQVIWLPELADLCSMH